MRSHIVLALPDLWMNQVALNSHKLVKTRCSYRLSYGSL